MRKQISYAGGGGAITVIVEVSATKDLRRKQGETKKKTKEEDSRNL